jgi:hypothetical protein
VKRSFNPESPDTQMIPFLTIFEIDDIGNIKLFKNYNLMQYLDINIISEYSFSIQNNYLIAKKKGSNPNIFYINDELIINKISYVPPIINFNYEQNIFGKVKDNLINNKQDVLGKEYDANTFIIINDNSYICKNNSYKLIENIDGKYQVFNIGNDYLLNEYSSNFLLINNYLLFGDQSGHFWKILLNERKELVFDQKDLWNELLKKVSEKNIMRVADMLIFYFSPIHSRVNSGKKAIEFLLDSNDSQFILSVLDSIALKYNIPLYENGEIYNPLIYLAQNKKYETAKLLLDKYPFLVSLSSSYGDQYTSHSPIKYAISSDSIDMVNLFLLYGSKLSNYFNVRYDPYPTSDLYFSKSEEMDNFLLNKGIVPFIEFTYEAFCNNSNVRIRLNPSISSETIGYLNKNDSIKIIGITAKEFLVPSIEKANRWVKISIKGQYGWVFGNFISSNDWQGPGY